MVRNLIHDPIFLGCKADPATSEDLSICTDLIDTITAHKKECVGIAANMIGFRKSIIVFDNSGKFEVMLNPEIIRKSDPYSTEEGCLSLLGGPRPCKRYKKIKVKWQDMNFRTKIKTFEGFTAQIIQHEIDHTMGVLI